MEIQQRRSNGLYHKILEHRKTLALTPTVSLASSANAADRLTNDTLSSQRHTVPTSSPWLQRPRIRYGTLLHATVFTKFMPNVSQLSFQTCANNYASFSSRTFVGVLLQKKSQQEQVANSRLTLTLHHLQCWPLGPKMPSWDFNSWSTRPHSYMA